MRDDILFHSQTRGTFSLRDVSEEIVSFVKKEPQRFYKIIIGTDSHPARPDVFVTAVTVWRVGNGAVHFWTCLSSQGKIRTMRDRIWQEAISSITLAQELRASLQERLGDEFFWDGNEVHVDIGERGPTRELIESITGMIKGYDFVPVIKPYAFGASVVADRHT